MSDELRRLLAQDGLKALNDAEADPFDNPPYRLWLERQAMRRQFQLVLDSPIGDSNEGGTDV